MAATGDAEYAAWKAGYRDPKAAGWRMMAKPTVQAEVAEMAMRRLVEEGVPLAVDTIMEVMPNKSYKAADRLKAASMALAVMREGGAALTAENASQMTSEQLAQAIREADQRAKALTVVRDQVEAIEAEFEEVAEPAKPGVFD